jgi:hypothetical protein
MSVERVLINVADVSRSIDFYCRFLDSQVVGTVKAEKRWRAPQLGAPGFVAVSIRGTAPAGPAVGSARNGAKVFTDEDGLLCTVIA